jgi:hypothetical protein
MEVRRGMSSTSRYEVVAAAAVKKFKEMIEEYRGAPEGLRAYLLKRLGKMEGRADELLAGIMDEIL